MAPAGYLSSSINYTRPHETWFYSFRRRLLICFGEVVRKPSPVMWPYIPFLLFLPGPATFPFFLSLDRR